MYTVITATGKTFSCPFFVHNRTELYIQIKDSNLLDIATVFSDPVETETLQWRDEVVTGYTKLESLSVEDGGIQVNLSRY